MSRQLTWNKANAKLKKLEKATGKKVYSISTLSGHSCIGAKDCLAMAVLKRSKLKLIDGPEATFRCYSASQEAQYPGVYQSRKRNLQILKKNKGSVKKLTQKLNESLPKDADIIRFFVAGDTFCDNLMKAQIELAKLHPEKRFYQYTKSIPLWVKNLKDFPSNYEMTASWGGKWDNFIKQYNLKSAEVVYSEDEAKQKGLEIDHDDTHACLGTKSFALLIHGNGKAGSKQAKVHNDLIRSMAV